MDFTLACWPVFPLCLVPKEFSRNEPSVHFVHNRLTLAQQGPFGTSLVLLPHSTPKTAHGATQSRVSFFAPKTSLPLPLKGEGLAIVFLGVVEFALLVYNRLTRLQQGLFRASLVSFPYSASKTAHRATRSRVWLSPLFPRTFLLWQGC